MRGWDGECAGVWVEGAKSRTWAARTLGSRTAQESAYGSGMPETRQNMLCLTASGLIHFTCPSA